MKKIPSTIVIHRNLDETNTTFALMSVTSEKNPPGKCIGLIRRGNHQTSVGETMWEYETV